MMGRPVWFPSDWKSVKLPDGAGGTNNYYGPAVYRLGALVTFVGSAQEGEAVTLAVVEDVATGEVFTPDASEIRFVTPAERLQMPAPPARGVLR